MAHNIFQDYFLDARGQKPWHGIGHYSEAEEILATPAFDKYTPVIITLEPMNFEFNGQSYPSDQQAVVRWPLPQAGLTEPAQLAVVGPRYTLVPPRDVAEIVDEKIGRNVETVGLLNSGTLFITIAMGGFSVAGDDIERYLLISAPCDGKNGYEVAVVNTRVVCNNTLMVALAGATQRYTIRHNSDARYLLAGWMEHAWEEANDVGEDITEAFHAMAAKSLTPTIADALIGQIFPLPTEPDYVPVEHIMERRMEQYETKVERVNALRDATWQVWDGGKSYEAQQGYKAKAWDTTWGLYNAANEVMEYGGSSTANKAINPLFGDTRRSLMHNFTVCHEFAVN